MTSEILEDSIKKALKKLGLNVEKITLEHPDDLANGDYSTNVALSHAKTLGVPPRQLAEKIVGVLQGSTSKSGKSQTSEKIEIAGPGFINFYLAPEFFPAATAEILNSGENFGKNTELKGKKVIVEYTDPNPFKLFHIGHLMSNAVGESLSRLIEFQGAEVRRACYQGDVGLHVAKTVWAICDEKTKGNNIFQSLISGNKTLAEKINYLGANYAFGAVAYADDLTLKTKKEIEALNRKIYEHSDANINKIYDWGREVSLEYFDTIYKKLGTNFDYKFFESETGEFGKKIVEEFLGKGVFEKSQGAIIFPGEKHALHTRVFINSEGLPTYEAKELGLVKIKYEKYRYDKSLVVTGNEINDYFKVLLRAMTLVFPELAEKTKHLSHGMLRLPSGKMSSRTGEVITAEALLADVEEMALRKLADRELDQREKNKIAEVVAVAAVKYSILRQAIGSDIIFDFDKSISFEGDSGPYLLYSYVRAKSVLEKAVRDGVKAAARTESAPPEPTLLERLLYRFPEVVERAAREYAPHLIATYLIEVSGAFNSFYAERQIVNAADPLSPYKVALTKTFSLIMKNGLWLLGISVPEHM